MKFEIIGPDGKNRMTMHEVSCLPTKDEIKSMADKKFKFKLDGKVVSKATVIEMINKSKQTKKPVDSVPMNRLF